MSLSVRRLRNVFLASPEMPHSSRVCALVESSVRNSGVETLAGALDELLDPADPSVWIIRNLRVSFTVTDTFEGAKVWSRGMAAGIQRLIRNGTDGCNAIRFPDRASYWSSFLRDLASRSSDRWWYMPLESLRELDFGQACVTLLSRQPELTSAVLGMLLDWGLWPEVIEGISSRQAASLLGWITDTEETPAVELLEAAAQLWPWASEMADDGERLRLTLVTRLVRDHPAVAPAAICGAVRYLEQARLALHRWLEPLEAGNEADLTELVRTLQMNLRPPLPMRSQVQLQQLSGATLKSLLQPWIGQNGRQESRAAATALTEFGGWFLLLPSYIALNVDELVGVAERPLLRWLIARLCFGPRGRAAPRDDPGLLWASALETPPDPKDISSPDEQKLGRWADAGCEEAIDRNYFPKEGLEGAWAPVAAAVLRRFAQELPGFSRSSPFHLETNMLAGRTSLRFTPTTLEVSLLRRPLDIVLRMVGMDGLTYFLPWKNDATIRIHLD